MAIAHTIHHKFNSISFVDNLMVAAYHEIELDVQFGTDIHSLATGLSLIEQFFAEVMQNCVCFKYSNPFAAALFFETDEKSITMEGNPFMMYDEPSDELMLMLLVRKLNSLIPDDMQITYAIMHTFGQHKVTISYDAEYVEMPDVKYMVGELAYYDQAWWDRADFDTCDFCASSEEELQAFKEECEKQNDDDSDIDETNTSLVEQKHQEPFAMFERSSDDNKIIFIKKVKPDDIQ